MKAFTALAILAIFASVAASAKCRKDVKDDSICGICQAFVGAFADDLKNATLKAEVKQGFLDVCKELEEYEQVCTEDVTDNFDEKYAAVLALMEKDPKKVCDIVGLCTESTPHKKTGLSIVKGLQSLMRRMKNEVSTLSMLRSARDIFARINN